ncbi:MAG: 1-acyl-sn-glycerol-3-phosphate acyltransferase [Chloroflexi bacterium]|nr:1-acyl-sn-glycerol-3-phosphate acyltransferase [Chloroflexota bacterium]
MKLSADWPDDARKRVFWSLLFRPARALMLFLAPVRIEGRENVPASGAFIVVANHVTAMDPPWLVFALGRPIRWMGKSELFELFFVGWALRLIDIIPVRRGESDRRAVVRALMVLRQGLPLGLFPEGHRSPKGALLRGRGGIAFMAKRTGAILLPVGLIGMQQARIGRFWRRDITMRIGPPFYADDLPEARSGDNQELADGVMRRIAALLPAEQRGAYRDEQP